LPHPGTLWVDKLVEVEQDPTGLQALLQKAESILPLPATFSPERSKNYLTSGPGHGDA